MPQIWLTEKEIGVLFDIPAGVARLQAIEADWPRRHSSDGHTRFKLSDSASHLFMIGYAKRFYEVEAGLRSTDEDENEEQDAEAFDDEIDPEGEFSEDEAEEEDKEEHEAEDEDGSTEAEAATPVAPVDGEVAAQASAATPETGPEFPIEPAERERGLAEPSPEAPAASAAPSPDAERRERPPATPHAPNPDVSEAEAKRADAQYWAEVFQRAFEDAKARL